MISINQKIVGYSVIDNDKPDMIRKLTEREPVLIGKTYKLKTPLSDHALYITINDLNGRPFEIFINSKDMSHFQWVIALTRVMSAVFRHQGEIAFLVDELMSVLDPKGGYFYKGKYRGSLVSEIGSILKDHLIELGLIVEDRSLADAAVKMIADKSSINNESGKQLCSKCNELAVVVMDGCLTCVNCGDSKCG